MGLQDRDWYKEELRERERKLKQIRRQKFRFRLPRFGRRVDLSAYNFERKPSWHPVLIALVWAIVFLVLFAIFKRFR
jgi:hypothetical protein